jgi:L-amino acid N-acyltransferase YncA
VFIASQIIGAIAFIVYLFSYWQKDRQKLLMLSIVECVFFAAQYFLLRSVTGGIINIIGIVRSAAFMRKDNNKFFSSYAMPAIMHLLYTLNCVFTWTGLITLIPTIASYLKCHSLWQNNSKIIRIYSIPIQFLWLFYGIYLGSYVSIVSQIILIISISIAIVRLDILKDQLSNYKVKINVYLNALENIFKNNNQNFVYDKSAIKNPNFIKFVCLKGNKPVGYIALYPQSDFMEMQGFPKYEAASEFSIFIWHIIVRKGYERKEVASTLLKEIEKVYNGYEIYSVFDARNNPSILFHSTKGFVKKFDFQRAYFRRVERFNLMQLKRTTSDYKKELPQQLSFENLGIANTKAN